MTEGQKWRAVAGLFRESRGNKMYWVGNSTAAERYHPHWDELADMARQVYEVVGGKFTYGHIYDDTKLAAAEMAEIWAAEAEG